jgi:hypothetical protein
MPCGKVGSLVGHTKSGKAENHAAGVKVAQLAIDRALGRKRSACSVRNKNKEAAN